MKADVKSDDEVVGSIGVQFCDELCHIRIELGTEGVPLTKENILEGLEGFKEFLTQVGLDSLIKTMASKEKPPEGEIH